MSNWSGIGPAGQKQGACSRDDLCVCLARHCTGWGARGGGDEVQELREWQGRRWALGADADTGMIVLTFLFHNPIRLTSLLTGVRVRLASYDSLNMGVQRLERLEDGPWALISVVNLNPVT